MQYLLVWCHRSSDHHPGTSGRAPARPGIDEGVHCSASGHPAPVRRPDRFQAAPRSHPAQTMKTAATCRPRARTSKTATAARKGRSQARVPNGSHRRHGAHSPRKPPIPPLRRAVGVTRPTPALKRSSGRLTEARHPLQAAHTPQADIIGRSISFMKFSRATS